MIGRNARNAGPVEPGVHLDPDPHDWDLTYLGPTTPAKLTVEFRFTDGRVETTTVAPGDVLVLPDGCCGFRCVQ